MNLPEWYASTPEYNPSFERASGRNLLSARKALASIGEVLAIELSGANSVESWYSGIASQSKILGILMLALDAVLLHSLLPLAALFVLTLALALSCKLSSRRLARLWLGVPLFSGAIILPALLNVVTPGSPALIICRFGENAGLGSWHLPSILAVTHPGLVIGIRFVLRSLICITLTGVLTTGTDSPALIDGLRRLGMPKIFGMTLAMMQRYMSLILRIAEEIHLAKLSRSIDSQSIRNEQRWVAAGIGVLFGKTYRLAEEVRQAMVSRGYDGDLQIKTVCGYKLPDFLWLIGVLLVSVGTFLIDRL